MAEKGRVYAEKKILSVLKEKPLQTSQVAEKLGLERHTTVKYLESLESRGILKHEVKRRAKLWRLEDNPVIDVLKNNAHLGRQLAEIFDDLDEHISIKDKHLETIWKNQHAKANQVKCHEFHFNKKQRCENCPVEKTFKSGKPEVLEIRFSDTTKKIITKPIKNENNETIAVVEIIKQR
ncbi:MAG: FaeA/PapI family transcriptional regulator [Candidatus Nanoarchaeia archaeon]